MKHFLLGWNRGCVDMLPCGCGRCMCAGGVGWGGKVGWCGGIGRCVVCTVLALYMYGLYGCA